jgi:hypothetical protein
MAATIAQPPRREPASTQEIDQARSSWAAIGREGRWILAAAGIGFAVSAICAQTLHLARPWVVLVLAVAVALLSAAYVRAHRLDVGAIVGNRWLWAIVRGVVMGGVLVILLLPDDPTPRAGEPELALSVLWLGVVYGTVESLLVNAVPMMAAWRAFQTAGLTRSLRDKIIAGAGTMAANLLVTAAYNLGFPEFRGPEIAGPASSNFLIGVGFVLAPNPLISIISHIILHVASVLAGGDGPVNLPPHY